MRPPPGVAVDEPKAAIEVITESEAAPVPAKAAVPMKLNAWSLAARLFASIRARSTASPIVKASIESGSAVVEWLSAS